MKNATHIRAIFGSFTDFERALRSLMESGQRRYEAFGPIDLKDVEDLMPRRGSSVQVFATAGAFIGLVLFFLMCVAASLLYGQVVGGKPPVSKAPFIIVSYEGTILLGAMAAFIATIVLARLRPRKPAPDYDPRFSGADFGIDVYSDPDERNQVVELLREAGAVEINEIR